MILQFPTREERNIYLESRFSNRTLIELAPGCFNVPGGTISVYDRAIYFESSSDISVKERRNSPTDIGRISESDRRGIEGMAGKGSFSTL